jgi:hypothetical protein
MRSVTAATLKRPDLAGGFDEDLEGAGSDLDLLDPAHPSVTPKVVSTTQDVEVSRARVLVGPTAINLLGSGWALGAEPINAIPI